MNKEQIGKLLATDVVRRGNVSGVVVHRRPLARREVALHAFVLGCVFRGGAEPVAEGEVAGDFEAAARKEGNMGI